MKNLIICLLCTFAYLHNGTTVFAQGKWTKKANFPPGPTSTCIAFSLNGKGYVGLGDDGSFSKKFMNTTQHIIHGLAKTILGEQAEPMRWHLS